METALAMPDLSPALAEIILAVGAMALLLIGVFRGDGSSSRAVSSGSIVLLIVAAFAVISHWHGPGLHGARKH